MSTLRSLWLCLRPEVDQVINPIVLIPFSCRVAMRSKSGIRQICRCASSNEKGIEGRSATCSLKYLFVPITLAMMVLAMPQNASSQEPHDTSDRSTAADFFALMRQVIAPPNEQNVEQPEFRDPTAPSNRILEYLPQAERSTPKSSDAGRRSTARPASPNRLPALPKITIKGLVLSTPDSGTAMLDVSGKSVSISLLSVADQQRLAIPSIQFAAMKPALEQRKVISQSGDFPASRGSEGRNVLAQPPVYEMSLQCSFTVDGVIFNLEAFTADTLLFRVIPHGDLLLVKKGS